MTLPAKPPPPARKTAFEPYRNALKNISTRTGTPLSSLAVSFAIIHELSAIVPLVGFFYGARALGVGETIINTVVRNSGDLGAQPSWFTRKFIGWVEEGETWAGRVGRRYGVFGFEKGSKPLSAPGEQLNVLWINSPQIHGHLAGDLANAVVAYGATKAIMPLRIGFSVYFSPAFSRGLVDPLRRTLLRAFRRS